MLEDGASVRQATLAVAAVLSAVAAIGCALPRPSASPGPNEPAAIEAVTILSDGRLVAVGSRGSGSRGGQASSGLVAWSEDSGLNWSVSDTGTPDLTFVAATGGRIVASRYCLAPTGGGQAIGPTPSSCLFASDDEGDSWRDLGAGRLVDPTFVGEAYGWSHEQDGPNLYESVDGGETWSALDSGCPAAFENIFRAVTTGPQAGFLICFGEPTEVGQPWTLVERSADGHAAALLEGNSSYGEATNGLRDQYLRGFSIRPDGQGMIWTSDLYGTTDGGESWAPISIRAGGFERGEFWGGGTVLSSNLAYLVMRGSISSIVEYRSGVLTTLVEWPLPTN